MTTVHGEKEKMRLIDADKLKQDHFMGDECETCINDVGRCQNWHVYTKMDFCGWIDDALTVDAVPVVRCKDCKYAHMTHGGECKYCDVWEAEGEMYLDGDFYCAFGERREDDSR